MYVDARWVFDGNSKRNVEFVQVPHELKLEFANESEIENTPAPGKCV